MPWRITRFLLKDMIAVFLAAIVGLTSLLVVLLLMQLMRKIDGVGASSLLELVPTIAFGYQAHLIPIACLIASALAYGRLHSERETIAIYAGGVAPRRLLWPAALFGLALCLPAGYANFVAGPKSYRERDSLKRRALADVLEHPPPGERTLSFPNITISYKDYRNDAFEGVVVMMTDDQGRLRHMLACTHAALRFTESTSVLTLLGASDATLLHFDEQGRVSGPSVRMHIRSLSEKLPIDTRRGRVSPKADGPLELFDYMEWERAEKGAHGYHTAGELVKRSMFTLAPLIFALTGGLIGLLLRTKNRIVTLSVALGLACGLVYPAVLLATSLTSSGSILRFGLTGLVSLPAAACLLGIAAVLSVLGWRLHRV